MADYEEQMLALQKPLQPDRVVWRVQQSGFSKQGKPWAMVLAYMDNRAVQERFDEVFGRSTVMDGRTNSKQLQMVGHYVAYPLSLETNGSPNGMAQKILRLKQSKVDYLDQ